MSQHLVEQTKAQLIALGVNLSGPCGAFEIVKRVAWAKRHEGGGLIHKRPEQNGCSVGGERYGVDIVMYPDGRAFDCLSDAGGENGPLWSEIEPIDPSLYRPAIDPGDTPIPEPEDPPPPLPPTNDLALVLAALKSHHDDTMAKLELINARIALVSGLLSDQITEIKMRQDRPLSGRAGFLGTVTLKPQG